MPRRESNLCDMVRAMRAIDATPVPLVQGEDGVLLVAGTRVALEVIVSTFEAGATAEEIVEAFPTLDLPAVYAVLAWVLAHPAEVQDYLALCAERGAEIWAEGERRFPQAGLRARLLARRSA